MRFGYKIIIILWYKIYLVCVKWRLHFEFVTSTKTSGVRLDETKEGTCWTGPEHVDIETMVWDLPIQIYPSVPSIANDPHAQTRITIAIWFFSPSYQYIPIGTIGTPYTMFCTFYKNNNVYYYYIFFYIYIFMNYQS